MSVNQIQVHVENIKCGGCEKSIVKGLNSIEGLSNIVIDRDQQLISVTADESLREAHCRKAQIHGLSRTRQCHWVGCRTGKCKVICKLRHWTGFLTI